jgi:hypothetical protein
MRTTPITATMGAMGVAGYLAELDASLVGPARVRRDLVREAGDHLEDATEAYRRAGRDHDESERLALRDFGTLDEIVPAFQTTLAVASARRTAWLLLGILSIQPFLWDGGLVTENTPPPDGLVYALLDTFVEVVGGATIVAVVVLAVASGIGNRWFHAGRGLARLTSYVALGVAVTTKLSGIAMTVLSEGMSPLPWLMLAVFILVPMSVTGASARRTLAAC